MSGWKVYNGIDITVDESGEFCAEVNGLFLRHSVWEHLRQRIESEVKTEAKALKIEFACLALVGDADAGDYSVQPLTLVGLNRKDSTFKWAETIDKRRLVYVLPNTPLNAKLLDQLAIAKSTVREIEQGIKDRILVESRWGGRIEPTKYNDSLSNLKERYKYALESSK